MQGVWFIARNLLIAAAIQAMLWPNFGGGIFTGLLLILSVILPSYYGLEVTFIFFEGRHVGLSEALILAPLVVNPLAYVILIALREKIPRDRHRFASTGVSLVFVLGILTASLSTTAVALWDHPGSGLFILGGLASTAVGAVFAWTILKRHRRCLLGSDTFTARALGNISLGVYFYLYFFSDRTVLHLGPRP